MKETYHIPKFRLPILLNKVEKLNRRAKKIGCPLIEIQEVGRYEAEIKEWEGRVLAIPWKYEVVEVSISGESPKYKGWAFLGTIDHDSLSKNLIKSIPGAEIPVSYREADPDCNHCKIKRFRKRTFVCQHDDGQYIQVGSSCVKDFLGHQSPGWIASYCELLIQAGEVGSIDEERLLPRGEYRFSVKDILALAVTAVNNYGWVPKSKAGDWETVSTCGRVCDHLFGKKIEDRLPESTEEDKLLLKETIIWAQKLGDKVGLSDYEYNITTIANTETVNEKNLGLTVSIVGVYKNHRDREIEKNQKEKDQVESQYFGEIKQRIDLEVKVLYNSSWEGQWGYTTLYKMVTPEGNICTWFSSNGTDLHNESSYKIKGTIKDHSEYKGRKETVLTRIKVLEE